MGKEEGGPEAGGAGGYEIKTCNMSPKVEKLAVGFVLEALAQGRVEKDMATQIKKHMDASEAGGTWHCILGQDFGASLCFENKYLLFLKAQEKHVLLFRSFDQL